MKKSPLYFIGWLAVLFLSAPVQGLETEPDPGARKAAEVDLEDLKNSLKDDADLPGLLEMLGAESLKDAQSLKLGVPMRQYRVDFAKLQRFQPRDDASKLLIDMNRVTYPLILGNSQIARSLLTVRKNKSGTKWISGGWGSPEFANNISKHRKPSDFMVWIPELNLFYLGSLTGGEFKLTSIGPIPEQDFVAGQSLPGETVFTRVQPEAKARKPGIR